MSTISHVDSIRNVRGKQEEILTILEKSEKRSDGVQIIGGKISNSHGRN